MGKEYFGKWVVWAFILLVIGGCQEKPTPTPTSTILPVRSPQAILSVAPQSATAPPATVNPSPSARPLTAAEATGTALLPSLIETAVAPQYETRAFTSSQLQATVLARRPNAFVTLDVAGNLAYIGHGDQLEIVDVSEPERPILRSTLPVDSQIKRVMAVDDSLFLVLEHSGAEGQQISLQAVDVSDPANPALQDAYMPDFQGKDAAIVGDAAYMIGTGPIWIVLDVSNPNKIAKMGTIFDNRDPSCPGAFGAITAVSGNLHLVSGPCRLTNISLSIFDVSNPEEPQSIQFFQGVRYIVTFDSFAYGLNGGALQWFDISTQSKAELLGSILLTNLTAYRIPGKLLVVNGYVYYAYSDGLHIVEQVNPIQMEIVHNLYPTSYISDMVAVENFVYLLDWDEGLIILDASNPAEPVEVGRGSQ